MGKDNSMIHKKVKNQGTNTEVPENQNQNHNAKKEALGPNTKR